MVVKDGRYYCANGTGRFASELASLGNDVTMFGQQVIDPSSTSSYDILDGGVNVAGLKRYKSKLLSYLLLYSFSIKYILESDFVYLFYPTSYCYIPFICRFLRKKYGLYVRGTNGIDNGLSKALYRGAYVVFTVASHFTDIVNEVSKKSNGHTVRPMISYTDKDVVIDRQYHSKDKYSILLLSRIEKDKGIDELLEAFKNLINKGINNIHLTIVGGGGYLENARYKVKLFNISRYVTIEGNVDDEEKKKSYYRNADIYILPTYHEGFPRTLYEAMIYGTPIITTFVGGIHSLMVDGNNCVKIIERSSKSIEEKLQFAIDNYEMMGKYAINATQTIQKVVDPKRLSHAEDLDRVVRQINK